MSVDRDGWTGPWLVRSGGQTIATIVKPSAFSRSFDISFGGQLYALKARTWSWSFDLCQGGQHLGSLERYGLFSRKMTVNLPEHLPLILQAIAAWMVLLMWRRDAAAAAS